MFFPPERLPGIKKVVLLPYILGWPALNRVPRFRGDSAYAHIVNQCVSLRIFCSSTDLPSAGHGLSISRVIWCWVNASSLSLVFP